jgi:hypothetical protein
MGAKVARGEVVGRSGKTSTVGGYYGAAGYPHLHLTTLKSPTGEYQIVGSAVRAPSVEVIDPVVVYHEARAKPPGAVDPSPGEKAVPIPYVTADGKAWPQGTRVIWPVACRQK